NDRYRVGPADRVLSLAALSFDMSVYEIFGLLAAGGAVVLPEPAAETDPVAWWGLVRAHGGTLWHSVPARMGMLLDQLPPGDVRDAHPVRRVLLGGDRLPPRLLTAVWSRLGRHVEVHNVGGVTEASIYSNCHPADDADATRPAVPYGVAMRGQ